MPDELRVLAGEQVVVESEEEEHFLRHFVTPDLMVIERTRRGAEIWADAAGEMQTAGVAVAEPLVVHVAEFESTQRHIEIVDASSGNRVITVIEFVSPSNKRPGDARRQYLQKRRECRDAGVNFVEIDLTRQGARELMVPDWRLPPTHRTMYQACVFRAARPKQLEYYAMPLWQALPEIRIPLRDTDEDVLLRLQPLIDETCQRGRYDLDYTQPCDPELSAEVSAELQRRLTKSSQSSAPNPATPG